MDKNGNEMRATFRFTGEQVEAAVDKVYRKTAGRYKVQGFRDGKAPRRIIEQNYGNVFFEDAVNDLFRTGYEDWLREHPEILVIDVPEPEAQFVGGGLEITVTIPVQKPFELGPYKGLQVKGKKLEVADKDVEAFLLRLANDRARLVAAPAGHQIANGNVAVIDFVGTVDGVAFEGGTGKDYELEIGSNSFIDTFEHQLVGKTVGETIDVHVTFPKDYHAKNLAGKPAMFKTTIKKVLLKEVPAIDDDLAKESSGFETIAEFRADIKKRMMDQAKREIDEINDEALLTEVANNTKIELNPRIVDIQYDRVMADLQRKLAQSHVDLEAYAVYMGMTVDQFKAKQRKHAEIGARVGVVLDEIGRKEGLKTMDEIIKFLKENNTIC